MAEEQKEEGPRSFTAFLRSVDGGSFEVELAEEMYKLNGMLAQIASQNGKAKGEITIKLKLEHDPKGRVDISTDVAVKTPKVARSKSVMWVTRGGNLSDKNPKQADLPFRDVNAKAEPARDVAPTVAAAARSV